MVVAAAAPAARVATSAREATAAAAVPAPPAAPAVKAGPPQQQMERSRLWGSAATVVAGAPVHPAVGQAVPAEAEAEAVPDN